MKTENNFTVSIIVAVAENRAIGKNNNLIWYLPKDLIFFKQKTKNHIVIMGRKNYLSIPEMYRPLPHRKNIIITKNKDFKAPHCLIMNNIEMAIKYAKEKGDEEPFIIGGGEIYKYAIENNLVNRMYITKVHEKFEADVFFPEFDISKWNLICSEYHEKNSKHLYSFTICKYEKKI